jgi:hypothetical protein
MGSLEGRTAWKNVESVFFWLLLALTLASVVFVGLAFSGRFISDEGPAPRVAANFTIAASPARRTVRQAHNAVYSVHLRADGSSAQDVQLSLAGATGFFSNPRVRPPGSSRLTVTTSLRTVPATYPIRIIGRSGKHRHWTRVILVVRSATTAETVPSASPAAVAVRGGAELRAR